MSNSNGVSSYIDIPADTTSYVCDSVFYQKLLLETDTLKNNTDNTYAIGTLGKCNSKNAGGFKIGKWTEYYKSGIIRYQGNYALGLLRACCSQGFCYGQYSYKTGRWVYYHEDGRLRADILFDITLLPTESIGCGDTVYYKIPSINNFSKFFDSNNIIIHADSLLLSYYLRDSQGNVD